MQYMGTMIVISVAGLQILTYMYQGRIQRVAKETFTPSKEREGGGGSRTRKYNLVSVNEIQ